MENESIPEKATLAWVDSTGDRFQREVQVQGLLPDDFFNDQVVFRLLPDDVVQVAFYPGAGVGLGTGWRLSASTTDYCGRPRKSDLRAGPALRYQNGKGDELQQIVDEAACKVAGIVTGAYGRSLSRNGAAFSWSGRD